MGDISSLVVISGPTKSGKTTLVEMLCDRYKEFERVITATTREPRQKEDGTVEVDRKDYYFVDEDFFLHKRFLEKACVHGNWYGTPLTSVNSIFRKNKLPLWILDVQGAANIHGKFGNSYHYMDHRINQLARITYIFLLPTYSEMIERLDRNYDKNKEARIKSAKIEIGYLGDGPYDYLLDTSESLETNLSQIESICFHENSKLANSCRLTKKKRKIYTVGNWLKT